MKGEKLFTKYLQCCTSYSVVVVTMNKVTRQQAFNSGCGLPSINLFSMPQEPNRKFKKKIQTRHLSNNGQMLYLDTELQGFH